VAWNSFYGRLHVIVFRDVFSDGSASQGSISKLVLSTRGVCQKLSTPPGLYHHGFHEIAQLLCGVFISFQVSRNSSLPVDNRRVQRVRQETFILPGVHAE
jgi:hypothetical protein